MKRGNRFKNITGQRFGRLIVLEFAYTKNRQAYWKCQCSCPEKTIKIVRGDHLRSGDTKSCGCSRKIDLAGQQFEKLLVLEYVYTKSGRAYWKCLCDCSTEIVVRGDHLRSGDTKSCGCLQKEIVSELCKNKMGKEHPSYNPNLTDEERLISRKYPEYYEWRTTVYERDDYTCQCCGDSTGGNLCAHHKNGYDNFPELRTTLENGVTVCENCHNDFHHQYGKGNNTEAQWEEFLRAQKI